MAEVGSVNLTELTVDVVSAFVSNNVIRGEDLPQLIQSTHAALSGLDQAPGSNDSKEGEFKPAVSVRKSLGSREHIISLIDGKAYKSLKRHLSGHGLTPEEYRTRYNLPLGYPMVAPAYSEHRREVAKRLGLGTKGRVAKAGSAAKAKPGRGRPAAAKA